MISITSLSLRVPKFAHSTINVFAVFLVLAGVMAYNLFCKEKT
ncbi:hypothetical protein CWATWH8502_2364 [Crocosphaera watsonii WH 8502]|uniref:Uncharacterized protein n=5 Tax=Crocosphaera watsonii TaxID=263511 RepID=T2JRJ1_CROWT|nr:hypothetical protein CWATWH0003_0467 [Crocosphaera watsonii WH 0003]CCQ51049.1 hypothetical protein CWATWH8502_2364 [Crocosphaera watsonii WH 8502]CCQ57263.1 hypothetical protein CWATWH0005_5069 [Crocosphaera watsonii WH 0005]CCQ59947.1 hypothetical protein CWATWH0401_2056 [Crocosphaera watsonii WH 0401]CCQ67192.1 hypothetical protein CWATWH0402_3570 [Crocosphaera watsonii WH 0402]